MDPMAYLRSYLPPHETPVTKWTSRDHRTFVSALRLVQCVPEIHRFGALSLLLPGRTVTDVRRYFSRAGKAGLIHADGRVRRKIVCRARGGRTVGYPVFLKKVLSKFVKGSFPQVDDGVLKLPLSALNNLCTKIGSVDVVRTDKVEPDRAVLLAPYRPLQDANCRKPRGRTEKCLSDRKTSAVTKMQIIKDKKRSTGRKSQSESKAKKSRKLRTLKSGASDDILVGAPRHWIEGIRVPVEEGNHGAVKKLEREKRTIDDLVKISVKLKLQIRNSATHVGDDRKSADTLNDDTSLQLRVSRKSSTGSACNNSSKLTDDKHVSDGYVSCADARVQSLCKAEKRVRFANDLQANQSVSSPTKRVKHACSARDQLTSMSGRRQGQRVNVAKKVAHLDCESATSIENNLLFTRRMSTSRRLYCPPRIVAPGRGVATESESIGSSSVSCPVDASERSFDVVAPASPSLSGTAQVSKPSKCCSADYEAVNGKYTASGRKDQRCEQVFEPLEPFREDMVISLIDSDESFSNESDERLSLGSLPDTSAVLEDSTEIDSQSPKKPRNERQSDHSRLLSPSKRLSVDYLLRENDEAIYTNSKEQQDSKLNAASVVIPAAGAGTSLTVHSFCCKQCESQWGNSEETEIFQVVSDDSIQPTYTWSLPKTGMAWTKAWTTRHWSAHLTSEKLGIAEEKFHSVAEEAECLMKTMEIFMSMSDDIGARLGHRQERARLLRDFKPHFCDVTEGESVGLLKVSSNKHFTLARPKPSTTHVEGEYAYALKFLANDNDMRYEDIVDALVRRWRDVRAHFVRRLDEMENRQARELEGYRKISAVMQL